jgi:hypothetical protein
MVLRNFGIGYEWSKILLINPLGINVNLRAGFIGASKIIFLVMSENMVFFFICAVVAVPMYSFLTYVTYWMMLQIPPEYSTRIFIVHGFLLRIWFFVCIKCISIGLNPMLILIRIFLF